MFQIYIQSYPDLFPPVSGDTLSPLLFLLCFQPIVSLTNSLTTCGFQMKLTIPNSIGLLCVDSFIYVEWNEPDSPEPPGWYHCQVIHYKSDGKALLRYRDNATEILDLRKIRWEHTRKNGKAFFPFSVSPPVYQLKRVRADSHCKINIT